LSLIIQHLDQRFVLLANADSQPGHTFIVTEEEACIAVPGPAEEKPFIAHELLFDEGILPSSERGGIVEILQHEHREHRVRHDDLEGRLSSGGLSDFSL
jgi:hypothetical protein